MEVKNKMSDLKLDIDVDGLSNMFGNLKKKVQADLEEGVDGLAKMTHAKVLELADERLGSLKDKYRENVEYIEPVELSGEKVWIVKLNDPAMWIEDGRKSGFMDELLDGKSARTSKEGKKYAVIPFKHNESPSRQSTNAKQLAGQIKEEMGKKGLSWGKIEYGTDGSPRVGKLHNFDVETARKSKKHKTPLTYGVSIYQTKVKNESGVEKVRRDIMTFRIISEDHKDEGKWVHPGRKGDHLLDEAFKWAEQTWKNELLPAILKKYE